MITFPNCKINLGLNIISKRDDGFHNLETIFYPLPFYDVLEIIQNDKTENDFFLTGINIEDDTKSNLCLKAYNILKKDFPQLPFLKIYLQKNIPVGAGLGGGSADGAFMLTLLNEKFNLNLSEEKLLQYSLQLGSDCPFFIKNTPCFARSRGEVLKEIVVNLSDFKLILVNPHIHINTAWAFSQVHPSIPKTSINEIIQQPVLEWKENLKNDFEEAVFAAYPSLQKIKQQLYNLGAIYASMSGSGSTVFGIFKTDASLNEMSFDKTYFVRDLVL